MVCTRMVDRKLQTSTPSCAMRQNMYKTKKVVFLRFTNQSLYTSSYLNGVFMNTFSQNIMHLRQIWHYKQEL